MIAQVVSSKELFRVRAAEIAAEVAKTEYNRMLHYMANPGIKNPKWRIKGAVSRKILFLKGEIPRFQKNDLTAQPHVVY